MQLEDLEPRRCHRAVRNFNLYKMQLEVDTGNDELLSKLNFNLYKMQLEVPPKRNQGFRKGDFNLYKMQLEG